MADVPPDQLTLPCKAAQTTQTGRTWGVTDGMSKVISGQVLTRCGFSAYEQTVSLPGCTFHAVRAHSHFFAAHSGESRNPDFV